MLNKSLLIALLLLISNCGSEKQSKLNCEHKFADDSIELCLPSEDWRTEKFGKYILFSNAASDTIGINRSVMSITTRDDNMNITAETYRNQYLDSLTKSPGLGLNLLSKGSITIGDKRFYDFEMRTTKGQVYDYLMFYKKNSKHYVLRGIIPHKIRDGVDKIDFQEFFKSLHIK
ncbi:hypothetical protein [Psychroserpens sp.]|uniref:hypothetical protein n=1 Tax=Psychroserpens sp. TaxID=2020870 RepID=UPI001B13925A|nr:hypothetical protein [Psychroserpens sp.]MBO6606682.1 hypothetical protein [Psychroserpens sp.]MBO6632677.1 hypothetical protein [Psychroserpens sp.]MBO6653386.1 hypothetical protein [Psychroserpens sp.]MBO6680587.1 hypothetical protein [Psychroserpens sp.]MBO6750455.1 hypothetical protein [Psychroserpens sp.]